MTGIQALDTAVKTTEEWISALMARLGWQDREKVYLALLAALHALRDSLSRDEAGYRRAVAGVVARPLFRGLASREPHPPGENPRRLLGALQEGVHRDPGIDAEQVAHAVFSLLVERLPAGELEDAKAATPQALGMFWPG